MKFCKKKTLVLILLFLSIAPSVSCSSPPSDDSPEISIDNNYPRWLKSGSYYTDQTSGITFIDNNNGIKTFLLCDDIGDIHRLRIENDTTFSFNKIKLGKNAENFLADFPKKDFEEIALDKRSGDVYLSIEGNNPDPKKYCKIIKLNFYNSNINSDSIVSFEIISFKPDELLEKYLSNNISYEGMAVDGNYFYLGLEGFSEGGLFADSTVLFIADKISKEIVKEISTKDLGIHTICGLYSEGNQILWGIDRNNRKLFRIVFSEDLEIKSHILFDLAVTIPGYREINYVGAFESITMDEQNNIYLIDDPWKKFYVPSDEILLKLDSQTVNNFKKFIPIIYKFNLNQ